MCPIATSYNTTLHTFCASCNVNVFIIAAQCYVLLYILIYVHTCRFLKSNPISRPLLKIPCKSFKYNDVQKADSLNSVQVGDSPLDRDRSEEEPRLLLAQRVLPYRMIHLLETRLLAENDQRKSRPCSRATSVRLLMAACLVSTVYAGVARYLP